MRLPRRPDDLTPQWLTYALHLSGALPPETRIETVAGAEIGEERGFTGRIFRLRTEIVPVSGVNQSGLRQSLIAKHPQASRTAAPDGRFDPAPTDATHDAHIQRSAREIHF